MLQGFGRSQHSLTLSHTDRRSIGSSMARLRRFYVGEYLAMGGVSTGILAGTTFSDHFPIILNVFSNKQRTERSVRIPDVLFRDRSLSDEVNKIWMDQQRKGSRMTEGLVYGISQISKFSLETSVNRKNVLLHKEMVARRSLRSLQKITEKYPNCEWINPQSIIV